MIVSTLLTIWLDLSPADIEYLRRLAPLTNIIPLLARADLLSLTEQATCKRKIAGQLHEAGLRCFTFMIASSPLSDSTLPCTPYAVSTASGSDHELMDASLLMSPAYVQPLVSSELTVLVKHLFSIDGSSWLRHSAAKKYMQWREATNARPKHLYRPLSAPVMALDSATGALISRPPFTLARLHGYGSNSSAPRLEMVDWATDLQRSLTSERLQYEARTRGERAVWLTGELNDCVRGGMLINLDQAKEADCGRKKKQRGTSSKTTSRHQDPLGLLQVTVDLKAKGWLALEVFSSLGILGGLAYWLARQRWQTETIQSVDDWARMWEFDI